ncbi:MAG TPA: glycosyltransferase family 1 protein [Solirubrobacteraceae bacterium]|jgi:glycosyltransferase involved in cell wall biosynthesis|nr:glycosyltransferase family 1 protein [Solirubrobacteraceae bacterium]
MPAPRNVLLNALYLAPGVSGGPETYLRGLAPALAREFPDLGISIATTRSGAVALREDGWGDFARVFALPCEDGQRMRRQWAEQVLLPVLARRQRAQIVHSLASLAPFYAGARAVVTLHDVTFLVAPTFGRTTTWGMAVLVKGAARRADGLIAGTAAARDEISAVLSLDPARFSVVHHGHDPPRAILPTPPEEVRARYGLGESRVVICVAAKRPHKNQELLIRATALLDPDVTTVLAGHAEPYERRLRELVGELQLEHRVRFADYVTDADLEGLWAVASCAAFPTLGEGFGIPVIEALAHGVPVACSRLPVLEEVGGDLPHYFDPKDPSEAAEAIGAALSDVDTAQRGPAHAASYTWGASARGTFEVYERVMDLPAR